MFADLLGVSQTAILGYIAWQFARIYVQINNLRERLDQHERLIVRYIESGGVSGGTREHDGEGGTTSSNNAGHHRLASGDARSSGHTDNGSAGTTRVDDGML